MTDNEIISAWRGECRHPNKYENCKGERPRLVCPDCHKMVSATASSDYQVSGYFYATSLKAPDYSNDPAAWGPELFEAIERAGLDEAFILFLWHSIPSGKNESPLDDKIYVSWQVAKSTEAQKARALVMAIKEVEGWNTN